MPEEPLTEREVLVPPDLTGTAGEIPVPPPVSTEERGETPLPPPPPSQDEE
jgi:hypothetical protein